MSQKDAHSEPVLVPPPCQECRASWRLNRRTLLKSVLGTGIGFHLIHRAAYKQRARDLQEELEEAKEFNDIGRIEKLEDEIEFLTQELAGAVGLGGRNRKAASASERARVNVTRAIKAVIKKTGEQSESLGRYFATTIKTGNFCSYLPDPRFPVSWRF